jgi:DNA-binding transcriptional LysR family regulator
VDVAGNLARTLLLPALPQFLARYPAITLQIGESAALRLASSRAARMDTQR